MEIFNNLGVVVQCDKYGHVREKIRGCRIEENEENEVYFITKQKFSRDGSVKERKFLLPEGMSPEEYLSIERNIEDNGIGLLLAIKAEICATCNSASEVITKAREAYTKKAQVYAAAVGVGGWDRTTFSNFCAKSEENFH